MFNFGPLGDFVVFVLAIAIIVGCAILGLLAIIVEYLWVAIIAFFGICLIAWIAGWFRDKFKALFKRK